MREIAAPGTDVCADFANCDRLVEGVVKETALFRVGPLVASSHGRRRCYDAGEQRRGCSRTPFRRGLQTIRGELSRHQAHSDESQRANHSSRAPTQTADLKVRTTFLLLPKRSTRIEASGAGRGNGRSRQTGDDDDQQTRGVGHRIEQANDIADACGYW